MKYILLIFFVFFILSAKSQMGGKEYDCVTKLKLTPKQRLNLYPFNRAKKIQIVSFSKDLLSVPLNKKSLIWSEVKDSVTLSTQQVDSLTDILFNIGFKGNRYTKNISTAVGLDIAIIFFDSTNKFFEYIDVCFDCGEVDLTTFKHRKNIGWPCNQKLQKIKDLSIKSGLNF